MDLKFVNNHFNKHNLNLKIIKISKLLRLVKSQQHENLMAMYYIYIDNQSESTTNLFKLKYPHIINYNNCVFQLKTGELGIKFYG